MHQAHGLVAELEGVVDRRDSRLDSVQRAGIARGMNRNLPTRARRFRHGGRELLLGVLIRRDQVAVHDAVVAGLVDLGEIRAFLLLLAHHLDELLNVVGVIGIRQHVLRGIEAVGVLVSAEDVDGIAADAHPRAGNQPGVDGVAHRGVGGACALGAHIALGGEAGHQVIFRGESRENRSLRDGLFHRLQVLRAGMKEQVNVRVNQPGHKRDVTQVDDLGARRPADFRPGLGDALALHEHLARRDDLAALDVEHARGVQDDRVRLVLCVEQGRGKKKDRGYQRELVLRHDAEIVAEFRDGPSQIASTVQPEALASTAKEKSGAKESPAVHAALRCHCSAISDGNLRRESLHLRRGTLHSQCLRGSLRPSLQSETR